MFDKIDHIGIAVNDLDAAIAVYQDKFQIPVSHREVVNQQGVDAALLAIGDVHLELLAPLNPDTPIGRFLAKRGAGLHHLAYRVEDIAETLTQLKNNGFQLIDEQPRKGIQNTLVAFIHPKSVGGVLTEIVQHLNE